MSCESESQPPTDSLSNDRGDQALGANTLPSGAANLSLREAQQIVDAWIQQYGVRYFSELTNLGQLMEEVGELARIMTRRFGDQSSKSGDAPGELADELADILFVLICLANQTGIDLTSALNANLCKKTNRDHQRHRNNPKLASERPL
jgi:NTP pyrophosphatase (non-canonical NTP hydrolase)